MSKLHNQNVHHCIERLFNGYTFRILQGFIEAIALVPDFSGFVHYKNSFAYQNTGQAWTLHSMDFGKIISDVQLYLCTESESGVVG